MTGTREKPQTAMYNRNKLKLGIFSPNCSGGMAVTKVPERWDASWESNLKLAQMADEAGIEFLLPIARWKGYGGETDFEGSTLETITWACGLLAKTKNITVFGTVHAPLVQVPRGAGAMRGGWPPRTGERARDEARPTLRPLPPPKCTNFTSARSRRIRTIAHADAGDKR